MAKSTRYAVTSSDKTVARYPEFDKQINAEYFLVGSLASLFRAVLMAGAVVWPRGGGHV